jgi:hypothetical protein
VRLVSPGRWRRALVVFGTCLVADVLAAADPPPAPLRFELGQTVLELDGEIRLRFEDDRAFDVRGYRPTIDDRFLLSRVMLAASLRVSPEHRVFLQLRDAHETGSYLQREDFPRSNPFEDPLDVRQLFYEGTSLGGTGLGLRLGRQQISYGDQRLFGPGQWGNTGRWAWDAAVVRLKAHRLDAEAWLGRPVRNRPERWPNASVPKPVVAAVYARVLGLPARLDAFYVHKQDGSGQTMGERGSGNLRSGSFGLQAEGTWRRLDYALTAVVERGRWGQDRIHAAGASATVGWRFGTLPWRPRLRAVLTWGSGDSDPEDGVHGTFDGVLGGADIAFYGYCNLFFWANLEDRELQLLLRPAESLDLHVQAHSFALAASRDAWYSTSLASVRRDPSGASGRELGRELDARLVWRARRGLELTAGLSYFWPGTFVRQTGLARDATWLMLQVTISR